MIEGDSEEYDLFRKWTKDFDCQGYYSCEIGVRQGFSSKIIMDNVKNNFLHIGVDPYGDREYEHFDKNSGIKHKDGISPTYPDSMRDTMLQDFKWYLNSGKYRFHNMTDTEFMKHPHYNESKFAFVMLDGPIGVTTGICFYTEGQLDMHVGFRPNRAVMFPSDYYHTPHKSDLKGIRRYTATIFVDEYEEV